MSDSPRRFGYRRLISFLIAYMISAYPFTVALLRYNRALPLHGYPPVFNLQMTSPEKAIPTSLDVNALPDSKRRLFEAQEKVKSYLSNDVLNYKELVGKVKDLEVESSQSGFWDDQSKAQGVLSRMNDLKSMISRIDKWQSACADVEALVEMASEDPDEARKKKLNFRPFVAFKILLCIIIVMNNDILYMNK